MASKKWIRPAVVVGTMVVLAAIKAAYPARADDVHVGAKVHPGRLFLEAPRDVTSVWSRSRGLDETLLTVTDARGNGDGWRLSARPEGLGPVSIREIDVRCRANSTCSLPHLLAPLPVTLSADGPTLLLACSKGTGMGRIEVVVTAMTGATSPLRFSLRPA